MLPVKAGAEIVVLLSHNGFDVDQKLARVVSGIDVILTGHTHDAVPEAIEIDSTLVLSSGSHGKYLGRVDLEVKNGKVVDHNSTLIPVLSDVVHARCGNAGQDHRGAGRPMKQSVHGSSVSPTVCCTDGVISTVRGMTSSVMP